MGRCERASGREWLTGSPMALRTATLLSARAFAALSAGVGCVGRCERVWEVRTGVWKRKADQLPDGAAHGDALVGLRLCRALCSCGLHGCCGVGGAKGCGEVQEAALISQFYPCPP